MWNKTQAQALFLALSGAQEMLIFVHLDKIVSGLPAALSALSYLSLSIRVRQTEPKILNNSSCWIWTSKGFLVGVRIGRELDNYAMSVKDFSLTIHWKVHLPSHCLFSSQQKSLVLSLDLKITVTWYHHGSKVKNLSGCFSCDHFINKVIYRRSERNQWKFFDFAAMMLSIDCD